MIKWVVTLKTRIWARDTRDARKIIRNFQQHKSLVNCQATLGDLRFLRIQKHVSSIKNFDNISMTSWVQRQMKN